MKTHPEYTTIFPTLLIFSFFFFFFFYFWLRWVFVSVRGLSLVAASGGHSSSRCAGLSLLRPLLFQSTGSRCAGSVIVAHGPSCSAACGIFPDQGLNPCLLHWQADSQPLRHQGSPHFQFYSAKIYIPVVTFFNIIIFVTSSLLFFFTIYKFLIHKQGGRVKWSLPFHLSLQSLFHTFTSPKIKSVIFTEN